LHRDRPDGGCGRRLQHGRRNLHHEQDRDHQGLTATMDLAGAEQIFTAVSAAAAFVTFWALWSAFAVQPPIEGRLGALRTRRMKTRSEQAGPAKPSPKATSLGFMRLLADRLNLLRGAA